MDDMLMKRKTINKARESEYDLFMVHREAENHT